jgi:hypothetical protein
MLGFSGTGTLPTATGASLWDTQVWQTQWSSQCEVWTVDLEGLLRHRKGQRRTEAVWCYRGLMVGGQGPPRVQPFPRPS